ncbi:hypothetical protein PTKIN_Ptkin01aG0355600 [Pterospermum kingtungense]
MESYLQKVLPREELDCDRAKELKAFDDTKAGVKGLVDAGVVTVPRIFLMPPEDILSTKSEKWGFFQVNNHGIPQDVMNKVIAGVGRFHDEPKEVKMKFYSRENEKKVRYGCSAMFCFKAIMSSLLTKSTQLEGQFVLCHGSKSSTSTGVSLCLQGDIYTLKV